MADEDLSNGEQGSFRGFVRRMLGGSAISVGVEPVVVAANPISMQRLLQQVWLTNSPAGGDLARSGPPPASLAVIASLEEFGVDEAWSRREKDCVVCREKLAIGQLARELPCAHVFHGECIIPWLTIRNTCPVCRYELPTDDEFYDNWRSEARREYAAAPANVPPAVANTVSQMASLSDQMSSDNLDNQEGPSRLVSLSQVDPSDGEQDFMDEYLSEPEDDRSDNSHEGLNPSWCGPCNLFHSDSDLVALHADLMHSEVAEVQSAEVQSADVPNVAARDDFDRLSPPQSDNAEELHARIAYLMQENYSLRRQLTPANAELVHGQARMRKIQFQRDVLLGKADALQGATLEQLRSAAMESHAGLVRIQAAIEAELARLPPQCIVCQSRPVQALLSPCHCANVCLGCLPQLSACPTCRVAIDTVLDVKFPDRTSPADFEP